MKHTPEPWRVEVVTTRGFPGPYITADLAGGGDIADLYILNESGECCPKECAEANAARIVACVNACSGVPTEKLVSDYKQGYEPWGHVEHLERKVETGRELLREALDALEAMTVYDAGAVVHSHAEAILRKHGRAV